MILLHGFLTHRGFLQIETTSSLLRLSFPSEYRGDKRTAYSQNLSLNLSLSNVATGQLRIGSVLGRERPTVLVFDLSFGSGPQYIEV